MSGDRPRERRSAAHREVIDGVVDRVVERLRQGGCCMRVLTMFSDPIGSARPLRLRREYEGLIARVKAQRGGVFVARLQPPTLPALSMLLRRSAAAGVAPHVLHYAGHGTASGLEFEDEFGRAAPVTREQLQRALAKSGVSVVVINACDSATRETVSVARTLAEGRGGIPPVVTAAVGHVVPVADEAASLFSAVLIGRLARGCVLHDAFLAATMALRDEGMYAAADATNLVGDRTLHLGVSRSADFTRVFDPLPERGRMPEVGRFFGRGDELLELGRAFEDEQTRGVMIAGVGGIGKTALARRAAWRHAWRFPGGWAFVSASSGWNTPTAHELWRRAARSLMVPEGGDAEVFAALARELERSPALLVFDELEVLAESELARLVELIEGLPCSGSKVLLTLRPAPAVLRTSSRVRAMVLTRGLEPEQGARFVADLALRRKVDALADFRSSQGAPRTLAWELSVALAGHPKMLELSVALAATGGLAALRDAVPALTGSMQGVEVEDDRGALGERMERLLETMMDRLEQDGRGTLSLVALCGGGDFTTGELAAAADGVLHAREVIDPVVREREVERMLCAGVEQCLDAGLFEQAQEQLLRVHPTVQSFARDHLALAEHERAVGAVTLLSHVTEYVRRHRRDDDALERRRTFVLDQLERAWQVPEYAPFREDLLSVVETMGNFLIRRGHWPDLVRWRDRMMGARGVDGGTAHRAHQIAALELLRGNLAEARALFEISLDLMGDDAQPEEIAASLYHLAIIEETQGDLVRARSRLSDCLALLEESQDDETRAAALHQLAIIEQTEGNLPRAWTLLHSSYELLDGLDHDAGKGASLHQMALVEEVRGNLPEARALEQHALELYRGVGDKEGIATSLHELALLEIRQGDLVEAKARLRESLALYDEMGDKGGRAASLHELAFIESTRGNIEQARARLLESVALEEELGNKQGKGASLQQLAALDFATGDLGAARVRLRESMALMAEVGDKEGRAASLHELVVLERTEGNLEVAREWQGRSLALFEELKDKAGIAASLHQLAIIEERDGNLAKAQAALLRCLALEEELDSRSGIAAVLHQLAVIERIRGATAEARQAQSRSLTLFEELGDRSGEAASLHQLAVIEQADGNLSEAKKQLRQSLRLKEELGDVLGAAASWVMLGQLEALTGDRARGCAMVRRGIESMEARGVDELDAAREILASMEE